VTATGATATKIYEVAPYLTEIGLGAHNNGGLAINAETWKKLPDEVRRVLLEVGREFSRVNGQAVMKQAAGDLAIVADLGSRGSPPLKTIKFPAEERGRMVRGISDIAGNYVKSNESRGLPARAILKGYMEALKRHGATPLRDWA